MSNPFANWTKAQADEHNRRIERAKLPKITTAASLMAEIMERETKKKTVNLRAANGKSEADIQQEIEDHLKSLGRECWFTRSRMDRATTQRCGIPDFLIVWRGKPLAIEVKRPGCKETREQAGELLWFNLAGGTSAIVHSLQEAKHVLEGAITSPNPAA